MNIETIERLAKVHSEMTNAYICVARANKENGSYTPTTAIGSALEDVAKAISQSINKDSTP